MSKSGEPYKTVKHDLHSGRAMGSPQPGIDHASKGEHCGMKYNEHVKLQLSFNV